MSWRRLCLIATVLLISIGSSSAVRDLKNAKSTHSTASTDDLVSPMSEYDANSESAYDDYYPLLEGSLEYDYGYYNDSDPYDNLQEYSSGDTDYAGSPDSPDDQLESGGIVIIASSVGGDSTGSTAALSSLSVPCDTQDAQHSEEHSEDPADSELVESETNDPESDDGDAVELTQSAKTAAAATTKEAAAGTTDAAAAAAGADNATYDNSDLTYDESDATYDDSNDAVMAVAPDGSLVIMSADTAAVLSSYNDDSNLTYDEADVESSYEPYSDEDYATVYAYGDDDMYSGVQGYSSDGESSEYADGDYPDQTDSNDGGVLVVVGGYANNLTYDESYDEIYGEATTQ